MSRWLSLFVTTRAIAIITAVLLLAVHRVSGHDPILIAVTIAYGVATMVLVRVRPQTCTSPLAWVVDAAVTLGLVLAVSEWRSPFYLLQLTALVLPATALGFRLALAWGTGYALAFFVVALSVGIDRGTLESTTRLESFATHMMVPMLVTLSLAYAAKLLDDLESERERSERLALEAERRRIAWELHDSAKQRVHAAHLLLSAGPRRDDPAVVQALGELRAATADMETSLGELRTPLLDGRRLAATCVSARPSWRRRRMRASMCAARPRRCRRSSPPTPTASPPRR
jgi:signal transduction histidine kinase